MSSPGNSQASEASLGLLYAVAAQVIWGVMPVYWRLLPEVAPAQLAAHRILWCAVVVAAITLARGRIDSILAIVRTPRTLGTLALTGALISANWALYLYCVATNQLVEASLGYYIMPLMSFVFGVCFFREKLSRIQWFCVGLAAIGVTIRVIAFGAVPWIGLSLATTFAFYGYFRKLAPVASLDGLLVETAILTPLSAILLVSWAASGSGAFTASHPIQAALLILGGALTALPLALYAAGVRRIKMTTLGFLQYLSPTITLVMAVFSFHEPFGRADLIAFAFVWVALAIVLLEGRFRTAPVA